MIRLSVSKKHLESALQIASLALGVSDLNSHFVFRVGVEGVEVLTSNQRVAVKAPLVCQVESGEGEMFTVEGWRLKQWVRAMEETSLVLECGGSLVTATSPLGKNTFASLDPKKFRFWDSLFEEAVESAVVDSVRLVSALSYLKSFISNKETHRPDISQTEARRGMLLATDLLTVASVHLQGEVGTEVSSDLKESKFRIHVNEFSTVTSFLSAKGGDSVHILEHDKCVFFKRGDGSVLYVSRPNASFPEMPLLPEDTSIRWSVSSSDLKRALLVLASTADKEEEFVKFLWEAESSTLCLSAKSSSGSEDILRLTPIEYTGLENLPSPGVLLSSKHLTRILECLDVKALTFSFVLKGAAGLVLFRNEQGRDLYSTALLWKSA